MTLDVLGIHIPSTSPLFLAVLAVHVAVALVAVGSGAAAMLARPKGPGRHTRFGRVYFAAISVVAATAAVLAGIRLRQDYHVLLLGALAFGLAATGRAARRPAGGAATASTSPRWAARMW